MSKSLKIKEKFVFSKENQQRIEQILKKYPDDRRKSAVLPMLELAQRQNDNHLSCHAIEAVAELLDMPAIKVYEVATFYSMFNLNPVGKNHVQVCMTTPCWLRGSDELMKTCEKHLGLKEGESNKDFTLGRIECLGACVNAPVVMVNDDYHEDLTEEGLINVLDQLKKGKEVPPHSQLNRTSAAPLENRKTLLKESQKDA